MPQLKQLSPDKQTKVLWLHHKAFHDAPCAPCGGQCCEGCARNKGYQDWATDWGAWGLLSSHVFAKQQYDYGWDEKKGYLGPNGCKLPVTERSEVCLRFMCGKPGFNKEAREASFAMNDLFFERNV